MKCIYGLAFIVLASGCGENSSVPSQALIIGDSISIGYTPYLSIPGYVVQHVQNEETGNNCLDSTYGLGSMDRWLGVSHYAVILFNFGIHDMGVYNGDGGSAVSLETYRSNLYSIVGKIKVHADKVVFVTTTDIPANVPTMADPTVINQYRQVALDVMHANGIEVIDVLAFSEKISFEHLDADAKTNVHWTETGYGDLAAFISNALANPL